MARLTDISIKNLKAGTARREIPDPGQAGLYIVVQPTGRKTFCVRYRFASRPRKLTLMPGIGLAAARKECASALYSVQQGVDPGSAKQAAKEARRTAAADTLEAVCGEFFKREGAKLRSAAVWQSDLARLVYPVLGARPISDIRRKDIVRLLDVIEDRSGPAAAEKTLAVIRRVMGWHAVRDDDFRSPIVRGMSRHKQSEHARKRILRDDELRAVWQAADETAGPFGCYLKFLLLTAARRNEAAHMKLTEVVGNEWVLPAARNKVKVDLTRPLSAAALTVLSQTPRIAGSEFAFSADGGRLGGTGRRKIEFDKISGTTGWTLHDLRRTARSLMARAGVPSEHAERCLGHVIGGVEGTYDRHDYKAEMLHAYEALSAQIERIINPQPNVVAMVRS